MTTYTYKIDNTDKTRVSVEIFEGPAKVACALVLTPQMVPNFEAYSVHASARGDGLSYALTQLMLLYVKSLAKNIAVVDNAHGVLIDALAKVGFKVESRRYDPMSKQNAASLRTLDINSVLSQCKSKMVEKGLVAKGFRNIGTFQLPL